MNWGLNCDREWGLSIDTPLFSLYPPGLMLFLPWLWLSVQLSTSGGAWIEVMNPRKIGTFGPSLMWQGGCRGREQWQWRDER